MPHYQCGVCGSISTQIRCFCGGSGVQVAEFIAPPRMRMQDGYRPPKELRRSLDTPMDERPEPKEWR